MWVQQGGRFVTLASSSFPQLNPKSQQQNAHRNPYSINSPIVSLTFALDCLRKQPLASDTCAKRNFHFNYLSIYLSRTTVSEASQNPKMYEITNLLTLRLINSTHYVWCPLHAMKVINMKNSAKTGPGRVLSSSF